MTHHELHVHAWVWNKLVSRAAGLNRHRRELADIQYKVRRLVLRERYAPGGVNRWGLNQAKRYVATVLGES